MQSPSRLPAVLLAGVLAGALSAGTSAGCAAMDKPAWAATKKANEVEANFYAEESANGRLYVIGKSATLQGFKSTGEVPYSVTYIGKGPAGETVVVEADAKETGLQARLRREFEARHGLSLK